MKKFSLAIFILFLYYSSLFAQTYYVSSSGGNDDNNGLSETSPWKTISKVNSKVFKPGDKILFKCGDEWKGEQLVIDHGGTAGNPINYSSYSTGLKPIITAKTELPGWTTSENWALSSPNVYRMYLCYGYTARTSMKRLWLDDIEYPKSAGTGAADNLNGTVGVNATNRFYFSTSNGALYVYALSNPASYYSSIETSGEINSLGYTIPYTLEIKNADYVILDGLDLQGGTYSALKLDNSSFGTIQNCNIGKYSAFAGITGTNGSNYVTIRNDSIDSDFHALQYLQYSSSSGVNYGITAYGDASHWDVHDNYIKWWAMGFYFISTTAGASQYHSFYKNEVTAPDVTWGKAGQVESGIADNYDNYIKVYNNYFHDIPMGINVSSNGNSFYYNIFSNMYGSVNIHGTGGYAFSILKGTSPNNPDINYIFNNTFYNSDQWACSFWGNEPFVYNNIFVSCGKTISGNTQVRINQYSNDIWKNNLFYYPTLGNSDPLINIDGIGNYTVTGFNSLNGSFDKTISGNLQHVAEINSLIDVKDFSIPSSSPALKAGIDISSLVPEGFTDRLGNVVDRKNPNIGAIDNSEFEPTGFNLYLQGSFVNGEMKSALKDADLLPKSQPYNIPPWNYNGNESVQTLPSEIVDWVLIELRSDISSSSTIARRAAFVMADGRIVDLDGISKVRFNGVDNGSYYIVIRHRNHLSIMSANKAALNETFLSYDFTTSPSKTFGNDLADLGNGKYGMYAGDGDKNGIVNVLDYGTIGNNLFQTGYYPGDCDLNGIVNVIDYGKTNTNLLKVSSVP